MNTHNGLVTGMRGLVNILKSRPRIPASLKDNQLLQVILKRRSVRSFTRQLIPEDVFAAIMEAGRLAPSTVNLQTWSFAAFTDLSWRQIFGRPIPFRGSRAVIIIADTYRDRLVLDVFPYSPLVEYTVAVMNASLAAMNMNLAAEALGVSSVMLSETGRTGLLDAKYLKEKLCLPDGAIPLMTIVFGYSRWPNPPMPPKIPTEMVAFTGQYPLQPQETMENWLSQMKAGYKASRPLSSFDRQLKIYRDKIGQAEVDLHKMIFYRES